MSSAPPSNQGADPEGARVRSLDARFSAIENEQREQRGLLDQIAAAVTGGGAPGAAAPPAGADGAGAPGGGAMPAGIPQLVREEIRAADERRKAEESQEAWRKGVDEVVEKVRAEAAPRDPETGIRGRLQRALFGRED